MRHSAVLSVAALLALGGAGCGAGAQVESELPSLRDPDAPGTDLTADLPASDGPGAPLAPEQPGTTMGEVELQEILDQEMLASVKLRWRRQKPVPEPDPKQIELVTRTIHTVVDLANRRDPELCLYMSAPHRKELTGAHSSSQSYAACRQMVSSSSGGTELLGIERIDLWGPHVATAKFTTRSGKRGKLHGLLFYETSRGWLIGQGISGII